MQIPTTHTSISTTQHTTSTTQKKLFEAIEGFESLFLQKLFDTMQNSIQKSSLLHSREEELWQSMLNEEYAKNFAKVGGIGLANVLYQQLAPTLLDK